MIRVLTLISLLTCAACSSEPIARERQIAQPSYYLDNDLPFQPKRLWRVIVRSEPYLLDAKKALIIKEFQLIVHDKQERSRIESDIQKRGGDAAYLNWLESELAPIGIWEKRETGRVTRSKEQLAATIITKAIKEIPIDGSISIHPIYIPDPLYTASLRACPPNISPQNESSWEILRAGDSVGLEVVIESRKESPTGGAWKRTERNLSNFYWRAWSVAQERQMSYRELLGVKTNVARCPLPEQIENIFQNYGRLQKMAVEW